MFDWCVPPWGRQPRMLWWHWFSPLPYRLALILFTLCIARFQQEWLNKNKLMHHIKDDIIKRVCTSATEVLCPSLSWMDCKPSNSSELGSLMILALDSCRFYFATSPSLFWRLGSILGTSTALLSPMFITYKTSPFIGITSTNDPIIPTSGFSATPCSTFVKKFLLRLPQCLNECREDSFVHRQAAPRRGRIVRLRKFYSTPLPWL